MKVVKSVELFFDEGSSDKVYKASIEEVADQKYVVNFAYGRRGSSLVTGSKTNSPVPYEKAVDVYAKLVNSKTGKGYQVAGSDDPTSIPTEDEARDTGFRPQLLNEIEESEVGKYLNDDDWCAQEKFDGRRRGLLRDGATISGSNRRGLSIALPHKLSSELAMLGEKTFVIDGEAVGEKVMLFDLLTRGLTFLSYKKRYELLMKLIPMHQTYIDVIPTAWTTEQKTKLYKRLMKENAEGIVFKRISAPYSAGRPNSGGDQLKFKFVATASCVVTKVNTKARSIGLCVFDEQNQQVDVGNVTVYPNQSIPTVGGIVEVKYLYYFPGGSLFQPVLLGERDDLMVLDATYKQLKLKREEVDT